MLKIGIVICASTHRIAPVQIEVPVRCVVHALAHDGDDDHIDEEDDGGEERCEGADDEREQGREA